MKKKDKNKLDKLWAQKVKEKTNFKCEVCGGEATNSHHIISRRYLILRYDLQNALALCVAHHFWCHNNPLEFADWFRKKYPQRHDYLLKEKNKIKKITYDEALKELNEV